MKDDDNDDHFILKVTGKSSPFLLLVSVPNLLDDAELTPIPKHLDTAMIHPSTHQIDLDVADKL